MRSIMLDNEDVRAQARYVLVAQRVAALAKERSDEARDTLWDLIEDTIDESGISGEGPTTVHLPECTVNLVERPKWEYDRGRIAAAVRDGALTIEQVLDCVATFRDAQASVMFAALGAVRELPGTEYVRVTPTEEERARINEEVQLPPLDACIVRPAAQGKRKNHKPVVGHHAPVPCASNRRRA